MSAATVGTRAPGDIAPMLDSFERHLRAENKSARTIQSYSESARQLEAFLAERGMPREVSSIRREHVEAFIEELLARFRPATAALRFRSLQQFFKWLVEDGEITESPMKRMRPPRVPEDPPPVLTDDQLRALLDACSGGDFESRRDAAILRVFIDTGARLAEVTGLRWAPNDPEGNDVDLDSGILRVVGKGSRVRFVSLGSRAVKALDRYLRKRGQHSESASSFLWLGSKGPMTDSGIAQVVRRRARQAGLGKLNPHRLRHTAAHRWLSSGGQEGDAQVLFGWRSRQMLQRYGASAAAERAVAAHRRLALGDRL